MLSIADEASRRCKPSSALRLSPPHTSADQLREAVELSSIMTTARLSTPSLYESPYDFAAEEDRIVGARSTVALTLRLRA